MSSKNFSNKNDVIELLANEILESMNKEAGIGQLLGKTVNKVKNFGDITGRKVIKDRLSQIANPTKVIKTPKEEAIRLINSDRAAANRAPVVPKTEVPNIETPKEKATKLINSDRAAANRAPVVPKTEVPKTEVPKTEVPKTEVPKTEVPKTNAPEIKAPEAESKKSNLAKNIGLLAGGAALGYGLSNRTASDIISDMYLSKESEYTEYNELIEKISNDILGSMNK